MGRFWGKVAAVPGATLIGRSNNPPVIAAVLIAAAALLTLPAALGPARFNDSFWIDWVWLDQFADQLRHGIFYPRWLPASHGGLGSPVFYYYPPLAFYLGAAFALAGLSISASIVATFFAAYLLSGAAMYLWLKDQAPAPGPLLGAAIYMIAPYHAFNFYIRGAVAEFLATALLPFVLLGIRRISRQQRGGFALAALGYAGVIASHLPLALLASLFLFGPYTLVLGRASLRRLLPIAAALALGIALAAIYLVPALLLEPYRDSAKLWHLPHLQPHNWTFWNPEIHGLQVYWAVALIAAALGIGLIALVARDRSRWAMYGAVCALLAIGLVPALWTLPVLRSVQFPFRLLPISEFALATAVALVPWRRLPLTIIAIPLLVMTGATVTAKTNPEVPPEQLGQLHPDVPENLPPGERPYSWPSQWALEVATAHRAPQAANGVTVEPVFYFPAWQVTCAGRRARTFPAPGTALLAYDGRNCPRRLGWTAAERTGAAISALALVILLALGARSRLRRRVSARRDVGQEVSQ